MTTSAMTFWTPPTADRYTAVCHKRYGWITAPPGYYFGPNRSGKMVYLYAGEGEEDGTWLFPFGTEWRATSIIAWGEAS